MSEPKNRADRVEVVDEDLGVFYWTVEDDRLGGFLSTAYALKRDEGTVLVDPLPLAPEAMEELGEIQAIVLSTGSHQRSAWRLRGELGVPVWAPALAQELDEEPDERYGHSMVLPGDLVAFAAPGPTAANHALIHEDYVGFLGDLVVSPRGGPLALTPDEWLHDPIQTRETVRLLLEQSIDVLCPSHGVPVTEDAQERLREALEAAGELQDPSFVEVPPEEAEPDTAQEADGG